MIRTLSVEPADPLRNADSGEVVSERQRVVFLISDTVNLESMVVRRWSSLTPVLSAVEAPGAEISELQAYMDGREAEYLRAAMVQESSRGISLEFTRAELVAIMNEDVNRYVFSRYDLGTFLLSLGYALTVPAMLDAVVPVRDWVAGIMAYYWGKKDDILTMEGVGWCGITWDFSQFDAGDPGVDLRAVLAG